MSDRVRIGMAGCGRAAERIYLPAFEQVEAARLVAVADPSLERRRIVADAAGADAFGSLEEMLSCEPDAVIVATPPETHGELAEAALRAGCSVLIEKPLASTLTDARRVVEMVEETGRPVLVGFNRRRLAAAGRLRRLLEEVEGTRIHLDSEFHALPEVWDPVAGARDAIDDLASHHLDLFRFLTGSEIETMDAHRIDGGGIELLVTLGSGARGRCTVSQGTRSRERVRVWMDSGVEGAPGRAWMLHPSSDRLTPPGGALRAGLDRFAALGRRLLGRPGPMARSFAAQLEALVDCARGTAAPTPNVRDGLAVVRAVERAKARLRG